MDIIINRSNVVMKKLSIIYCRSNTIIIILYILNKIENSLNFNANIKNKSMKNEKKMIKKYNESTQSSSIKIVHVLPRLIT